jgi:uncharacterized protein (UPF0210 family)
MRIRSITSFYNPSNQTVLKDLEQLSKASQVLNQTISRSLLPVQSTRLAATPFPIYFYEKTKDQRLHEVVQLENAAAQLGWAYLSLGPPLPDYPESYAMIPDMLAVTQNVFFGGIMADSKVVHPGAVKLCAEVIQRNAALSLDGFTNLRFASLANVSPWTPFLPAAYHQSDRPLAISLAIECADVVLDVFKRSATLADARNRLLSTLEEIAEQISGVGNETLHGSGIDFKGFDFSPHPP